MPTATIQDMRQKKVDVAASSSSVLVVVGSIDESSSRDAAEKEGNSLRITKKPSRNLLSFGLGLLFFISNIHALSNLIANGHSLHSA